MLILEIVVTQVIEVVAEKEREREIDGATLDTPERKNTRKFVPTAFYFILFPLKSYSLHMYQFASLNLHH